MKSFVCSAQVPSAPRHCQRTAPDACKVELCDTATRIQESIRLIQLGARAGLVCQLTGLERAPANRLYRQLRGTSSPPGQTPFSDAWYRDNDLRMLQATLVWRLHKSLTLTDRSAARVLIDVYEAYTQLVRNPLLNLTRTALVPRLVAMETWHERSCEYCDTNYLTPIGSTGTACPGCRLYHRHRCHRCGSPLAPQPRGRRRKTCHHCGTSLQEGTQR